MIRVKNMYACLRALETTYIIWQKTAPIWLARKDIFSTETQQQTSNYNGILLNFLTVSIAHKYINQNKSKRLYFTYTKTY